MLIANDVDVNATDASGMKAYDLAADYPAIQRALLLSGRLDAATKVTMAGVCLVWRSLVCLVWRIGLSGPYTSHQLVRGLFRSLQLVHAPSSLCVVSLSCARSPQPFAAIQEVPLLSLYLSLSLSLSLSWSLKCVRDDLSCLCQVF